MALVVAFPIIWFAVGQFRSVGPINVVDENFAAQRVMLDGKKFIRCNFDRCYLVFKGDAPFGMEKCNFIAPRLVFENGAAVTMFELGRLRVDPIFDAIIMDAIKKQ
jgi:hypothetical protein